MNQENLLKYLNTDAPTGLETAGQRVWTQLLKDNSLTIDHDNLGSAWGHHSFSNTFGNQVKIALEAHADEISWMVSEIDSNGIVWLTKNGGVDALVTPGNWGKVLTDNGIVKGVFGMPAIHVRDKDFVLKNDKIFLDVFTKTAEETRALGIHLCDPVIVESVPQIIGDNIIGKALDNKLGGWILTEVAQNITTIGKSINSRVYNSDGTVTVDSRLDNKSLYYINSVQEEIGCRGAGPVIERINPNIAFVIDVCHDVTAPFYNAKKDGNTKAGLGPVISYSGSINRPFLKWIKSVAKELEIPLQEIVDASSTHTDADVFGYRNAGAVTCLFSIPLKYMHTSVETANLKDCKQLIELLTQLILKLDVNKDWRPLSN